MKAMNRAWQREAMMPNFLVTWEKSCEVVVQAKDRDEAVQAANKVPDYDIDDWCRGDGWDPPFVSETEEAADNGVLDGKLVHIDDMPTAEELEAAMTEEERYNRDYAVDDPRQLPLLAAGGEE